MLRSQIFIKFYKLKWCMPYALIYTLSFVIFFCLSHTCNTHQQESRNCTGTHSITSTYEFYFYLQLRISLFIICISGPTQCIKLIKFLFICFDFYRLSTSQVIPQQLVHLTYVHGYQTSNKQVQHKWLTAFIYVIHSEKDGRHKWPCSTMSHIDCHSEICAKPGDQTNNTRITNLVLWLLNF